MRNLFFLFRILEIAKRTLGPVFFWFAMFAAIVLGFLWAQNTFAAVVVEDDFDSYSAGDLNTLNGGTGWSGAWTGSTAYDVSTGNAPPTLPNDIRSVSTSEPNIYREFTAIVDPFIQVSLRTDTSGQNENDFDIHSGATLVGRVFLNNNGNIQLLSTSGACTIGTWSASTWYDILIEYDHTNDLYRAKVDEGEWSDWCDTYADSANISRLRLLTQGGASTAVHWDNIVVYDADPTAEEGGSTASTTIEVIIPTASQEAFYGFMVFFMSMFMTIYIFKKR